MKRKIDNMLSNYVVMTLVNLFILPLEIIGIVILINNLIGYNVLIMLIFTQLVILLSTGIFLHRPYKYHREGILVYTILKKYIVRDKLVYIAVLFLQTAVTSFLLYVTLVQAMRMI